MRIFLAADVRRLISRFEHGQAIPKGLNHSAQGCEARATLGKCPKAILINPEGVETTLAEGNALGTSAPTRRGLKGQPNHTLRSLIDTAGPKSAAASFCGVI